MAFSKIAAGGIDGGVGDSLRPNVKPLLINADFSVMQRSSSALTGQTSLGGLYKNFDRWYYHLTDIGTWTIEKGTGPTDQGLQNSLKFDNTTADTSVAAASILAVSQCIEAQNAQIFNCGKSNAEKITVGFWVKATKTGTNVLELLQNDSDRLCCQTYSVSSSDTWEFKVVNFPADTSGSGINNDNGAGLSLRFYLAAGSNYSSGTLPTTWAARSNVNRAVGQINHADSTSNNFEIAGVQIEVGEYTSSTIPPFQHENYADNLNRCLRYYYRANGRCGFGAGSGFVQDGAVKGYIYHTMPVAPRTEMSFSLSATGGAISIDGNAGDDVQSIGATHSDSFPYKDYEFNFVTDGTSITDKCGMGIRINASHYIEGSAEL